MASSLSNLYSSTSLKPKISHLPTITKNPISGPKSLSFKPISSVARDTPADLSTSSSSSTNNLPSLQKKKADGSLEKDPRALWARYVEWLYQHKDLGLYLDVSRIGFSDEFVKEMEPRFEKAFKHMEGIEKGAIANPDEGRMVGHYWLRNSSLAPTTFLKNQIDVTLDRVWQFANDVISGKVLSFL